MDHDATSLPRSVIDKMPKSERSKLGKLGKTNAEIESKQTVTREKELQQRCIALLRLRGVRFIHVSRMDRRTTANVGTPDLIFAYGGRPCAFECKLPGNQPNTQQQIVMSDMIKDGWMSIVITSEEEMKKALNSIDEWRYIESMRVKYGMNNNQTK